MFSGKTVDFGRPSSESSLSESRGRALWSYVQKSLIHYQMMKYVARCALAVIIQIENLNVVQEKTVLLKVDLKGT